MKNILFVTSTSLATNPRLVKEVKACVSLNHNVTIISFAFQNWSKPLNDELLNGLGQKVKFVLLPGDRSDKRKWLTSTLLNQISRFLLSMRFNNLYLLSLGTSKRTWLLSSALSVQSGEFDFVIAHNLGSLVPAYLFSKKRNIRLGVDIEDFHPGEDNDPVTKTRTERILRKVLNSASVVTSSSPLIRKQTQKLTGTKASHEVVRNVFSLCLQPGFKQLANQSLKLVWFSQTVGLNRGIQDAIQAMCLIQDFNIELSIIGNCDTDTRNALQDLLTEEKHSLVFLPPVQENLLVEECSCHHIGLALEPGFSQNNSLALSNKIFTYLLAGNAIIASETEAQKEFLEEHRNVGSTYPIGNSLKLAELFSRYMNSPALLNETRQNAYQLAKSKLNWEVESQHFLKLYGLN